jgi:LemA protein
LGTGWIVGAVAVAILAGLYVWYATLIRRANKAKEALASIDVHLRQRHDLIPNLVKLAGRFMEHERGLIEEVTRLRARAKAARDSDTGSTGERFAAENALSQATGRLLVSVESYPALKSDVTIIEAQRGWAEAEAQITAARRFYNAAVGDLNNAIQVYPGGVLAAVAGVQSMPFFETPPETRAAPSVDDLLLGRPG